MAEVVITNDNFEKEVLNSEIPVLLDFWAVWCGPCQMIAPVIAEIAEEYEGKVKVGKVNVDEQPELAGTFGIKSIPTIVVMENGQVKDAALGYRPKEEIISML